MELLEFLREELNEEDYLYVQKYGDIDAHKLCLMFDWIDTPQGFDFWYNAHYKYRMARSPKQLKEWLKKELTNEDYEYVLEAGNLKAYSIASLFSWSDTPQGHDFWNNLDTKYME